MKKGTFFLLGSGYAADAADLVGIFDLDKTTDGKITREFLARAEKRGEVLSAGYELPKSFLVTNDAGRNRVILAQPAAATLQKRCKEACDKNRKKKH